MQLSGRRVLLTGATGGIGHAIARALHARGATLVLTGRRVEVLDSLAAEVDGRSLEADLSQRDQVQRLADDCQDVDVLVANAGLPATGNAIDMTIEQIDRALDVNLRAPIVLASALGARMAARGHGHIVLISSMAGKTASPRSSLYNATKFGLRGFGAALRCDLRARGVGVSVIFPGFIDDAGMFADSGVKLPSYIGTSSPQQVADGVVRAIERNRGEIDVAPLSLRVGAAVAGLFPDRAAAIQRRLGSERLADELTAGQGGWR